MASSDGNGWVDCTCGNQHWGIYGAAGIAIVNLESQTILLQERAPWTHGGQTWALPGGARDSHETPIETALRELGEELGLASESIEILNNTVLFDHGVWKYHTIIAKLTNFVEIVHNEESLSSNWVSLTDVESYDLHPAFKFSWKELSRLIYELQSNLDSK